MVAVRHDWFATRQTALQNPDRLGSIRHWLHSVGRIGVLCHSIPAHSLQRGLRHCSGVCGTAAGLRHCSENAMQNAGLGSFCQPFVIQASHPKLLSPNFTNFTNSPSRLGRRRKWEPYHGRLYRSGAGENGHVKKPTTGALGSGGATAMTLRAACSGTVNKR